MPKSIAELAESFLRDAIMVDVSPEEVTVERIEQKIMFVRKADKRRILVKIIKGEKVEKGIVFTRTKHGANRLVKQLDQSGINAAAIHGNKSQSARTKALASFKAGHTRILVATDIASRGIDVDGITHVFNYDLPNEPESYVHRIGRTARAGKSGIAYGFCDESESGYLVGIQNLIGFEINVDDEHEFHFQGAVPKPGQKPGKIKTNNPKKKPKRNHQNRSNKPKQKRRNNHNSRQPTSGRSRTGNGEGRSGNSGGRSGNNRGRSRRNQRNNR